MGTFSEIQRKIEYARKWRNELLIAGDLFTANRISLERSTAIVALCVDHLDATEESFVRMHRAIVAHFDDADASDLARVIREGQDYGRTMANILKRKAAQNGDI